MQGLLAERLSRKRWWHKPSVIDIGYISTYVPRPCGIATFTADVVKAVHRYPIVQEPYVAAVVRPEEDLGQYQPPVRFFIRDDRYQDYIRAAYFFNEAPVAVVNLQHEFGYLGGKDGDYICATLGQLKKPLITTLHTVLPQPETKNPYYVDLIRYLAAHSERLVVMNPIAFNILERDYGVDRQKVVLIYHGAPDVPYGQREKAKRELGLTGRFLISTFGLISRYKGLEYVLYALPPIVERFPKVLYLIIGVTHPLEVEREGESYREELKGLVWELGLQHHVQFINRFLTKPEIIRYLQATDIYLTPYPNPDQIVSGTLTYAAVAGKAIVATPSLYAQVICGEGRGIFINFNDSLSITNALLTLIGDPALRRKMEWQTYLFGRQMTWMAVGKRYAELFVTVAMERQKIQVAVPLARPSQSTLALRAMGQMEGAGGEP